MNKKLIYSLMSISVLLAGCNIEKNSNSVGGDVSSPTTSDSQPSISENEQTNYVKVDDVSELFDTYDTSEDYDFTATYKCDVIQDRDYVGGWETTYMYDGEDIQLSYVDNGTHFIDYFVYDATKDDFVYYLDTTGTQKNYQYLDSTTNVDYYLSYVSLIDHFALAGISWTEDMVYDLTAKKAIPANDELKGKIGKIIFGENPNEHWEKIVISWKDGYISEVEAISMLQEVVYIYEVNLAYHGYSSVKAPVDAEEFVDPTAPHLKGKEDYSNNIALSDEQIAALTIFDSELEVNYTLDVEWYYAYINGQPVDEEVAKQNTQNFAIKAAEGNFEAAIVDPSYNVTQYFYSISTGEGMTPLCFADADMNGVYESYAYETDQSNYLAVFQNIYINAVALHSLNAADFTYNETEGYITAKDEATEAKLCEALFYYADAYAGLRIYLKDNEDGGAKVIDKIVTSMVTADASGSYVSLLKTYSFTEIGTTVIEYPESVKGTI